MRYEIGARVRLKGLAKAAEHNGRYGSIVGYQRERIKVKLLGEEKTLAVKEANLEEVVDADAEEEQATDDEKAERHSEKQQQVEEEEDLCPLCLEPLVLDVLDIYNSKSIRFSCCGKSYCRGCRATAQMQLGRCPLCREAFPKSEHEHFERIRKHAAAGRLWACYEMGCAFEEGDGVPQNHKISYDWFRKAADQGYIRAVNAVGRCHEVGRGVKQSYRVAWEWYGKAVKVGFAQSQFNCAMMYLNGKGVTKDVPEGLRLLGLAAEQGFDLAQLQLARCYDEGVGVERSLRTSITWSLKAAKQNCAEAQYVAGLYLFQLTKDKGLPAAIYWLRRAAAQGDADAVSLLPKIEKVIDSVCANCGVEGVVKKRCSRCRAASYCSEKCQREHWRKDHKKLCCDKHMDIKDFELRFDDYLS